MKAEIKKESLVLMSANELAKMFSVSPRHLWRMHAAGKIPKAIKIGKCTRWSLLSITEWLSMNCPTRSEFETAISARDRK